MGPFATTFPWQLWRRHRRGISALLAGLAGLTLLFQVTPGGQPARVVADFALVLFVVGYGCYLLVTSLVGLASGRKLITDWPRWLVRSLEWAFVAVWLVLFVVRTATWIAPDLNPGKILLPGP